MANGKDVATRPYFHAVDGCRAIVHISLVALHAAMLTTGHLPSKGALWDDFRRNPIYTWFQAGGIQVDLMFMISGFLLIDKLLEAVFRNDQEAATPGVLNFALSRALRLLPPIIVVSLIGLYIGDSWDLYPYDGDVPAIFRIGALLIFVLNLLPASEYGSFTLSLCWSCCVDLHVNTFFVALFAFSQQFRTQHEAAINTAFRLRWAFLFLTVAAISIRAFLFEKDSINIFKLGQYSHFGLLMTSSSYDWIKEVYSHAWKTEKNKIVSDFAKVYLDAMYMPTHTRFGPFAVGGVLACNLFLAHHKQPAVKSLAGSVMAWLLTFISVGLLVIPCLPAADDAPIEAQFFATASLRIVASISGAFLLYRALVPESHAWHWKMLNSFLSMKVFKPIATLSYVSYLIHFRLLMELNFRSQARANINTFFGLLSIAKEPVTAQDWSLYVIKLFIVGFALSMLCAFVIHSLVEKPCADFLGRNRKEKLKAN